MPKHVKRLIPQEFTIDHSSSLKDALIKSQCLSFTSCPSRFCAQVFYPECSKKEEKKPWPKHVWTPPLIIIRLKGEKQNQQMTRSFCSRVTSKREGKKGKHFSTHEKSSARIVTNIELLLMVIVVVAAAANILGQAYTVSGEMTHE